MQVKLRVGSRLMGIREDRRLSQSEMADLLGVSSATYSRLERNDTTVELDQLIHYAKILNVPIQDFLPETFTINSDNKGSSVLVASTNFGTINYYSHPDEAQKQLATENTTLRQELDELKRQMAELLGKK